MKLIFAVALIAGCLGPSEAKIEAKEICTEPIFEECFDVITLNENVLYCNPLTVINRCHSGKNKLRWTKCLHQKNNVRGQPDIDDDVDLGSLDIFLSQYPACDDTTCYVASQDTCDDTVCVPYIKSCGKN